jgi:ribonuclease Z
MINGPFDDPGLLVNLTFRKQALLFDLGDLSALAPNDLLKVQRIFITHTHVDHFIGFDRILRLLLGRGKRLHLYGPHGFIANVAGKLAGYTWNLVQNYDDALVIAATEIDADRRTTRVFDCSTGFIPSEAQMAGACGDIVHQEPALQVRYATLDHQIPCLAYRLQERFHVNILKAELDALGLAVGPWIATFKALLFEGADPATEVSVASTTQAPRTFALGALSEKIARITRGQKIAYVTDAVFSPSNEEKIVALAQDADLLFIEASFLDSERTIAEAKYHLTARQAGLIARKARVQQMTLFHHSPRYTGMAHVLEAEARSAFQRGI